jgi:putative hemolysin
LSVGDIEEEIKLGRRRRRSIMQRSARTWCSSRTLGLVLTPHRAARAPFHRNGRWSHHSRVFGFIFTTVRTAATPLRHLRTDV